MKRTLTLAIALGTTLAVVIAGSASSVELGLGNDVTVHVPAGGGVLPACSDLGDNDGDGLIDLSDPGCSGPLDTDEYNAPDTGGGGTGGGTGDGTGGGTTGGATTGQTTTPTVTVPTPAPGKAGKKGKVVQPPT